MKRLVGARRLPMSDCWTFAVSRFDDDYGRMLFLAGKGDVTDKALRETHWRCAVGGGVALL